MIHPALVCPEKVRHFSQQDTGKMLDDSSALHTKLRLLALRTKGQRDPPTCEKECPLETKLKRHLPKGLF